MIRLFLFFLNIINGNERISSSRSLISHGNLSRCDVIISYHNQTSIQVGGGDEECGNNVPFPHNVRILSILIHRWIWRSVMCHSLNNYRDAPLHFKMKRKTRLCLFIVNSSPHRGMSVALDVARAFPWNFPTDAPPYSL